MRNFFQEFLQSLKNGFRAYFQFSGTSTRKEFSHWLVFYFLVLIFLPELSIFLTFPLITISIRRMRMVEKSIWWIFLYPLLIYFGLRKESPELKASVDGFDVTVEPVDKRGSKTMDDAISVLESVYAELSRMDKKELVEARKKLVSAGNDLLVLAELDDLSRFAELNSTNSKAAMWSGIILGVVCDGAGKIQLEDESTISAVDLLRKAIAGFGSMGESKMAGRAYEELGQLGRILSNTSIQSEGFDGAIEQFRIAGDSGRLQQAMRNSGNDFLRTSSSFFDGSKPSLRCTTILGSNQVLQMRNLFDLS